MSLKIVYSGAVDREGKILTVYDNTGEDALPLSTKYSTNQSINPNFVKSANAITEFKIKKPDGSIITKQYNILISSVTPNIPATTPLPIPSNAWSIPLDNTDLNYAEAKLPNGVFITDITVWFSILNGASGVVDSFNQISATSSTFTSIGNGFGDTINIKVISNVDSTKVFNTAIQSIQDNEHLTIAEDLYAMGFTLNESVTIFAGFTTQIGVKSNVPLMECFLPKVAKISVDETPCCSTCGHKKIDELMEMFLAMFDVEAQLLIGMYDEANKNILALEKICKSLNCGCK